MKKQLSLSLVLVLSVFGALAQQKMKDGTVTYGNLPNKDAILELESTNKGLLFSRVALKDSRDPAPLSAHIAGMMVYNTQTASDVVPGIYYNDGSKWILARQGQATNLSYNPTTYTLSFLDPSSNAAVLIDLRDVVKKNETLTSLVKQENGTYVYTAEDGAKTTINVPADVINNFQTIANTLSVKQIIENIVKNTAGNVFFDGTNLTYIDKSGATQIINLTQIVKGGETVTTLVKNTDGSYTYTNEKNDKVTFNVIGDINTNIINEGALYTTIKNVIDKEETVTSLVYDVVKNTLTYSDENKIVNTIDIAKLVTKNQLTTSLSNSETTEVASNTILNNTSYKVEVKNGAISTVKLANEAVTTEKIGKGAVTGDQVAVKVISADKLVANPTDKGMVGVVQADGTIVYQTLSSSNISGKDLTAEDGSIAVANGIGATLVNAKLKVADGGITTSKLADGAVTNVKVGADAITTDKIKDGEVKTADLGDKTVTGDKIADKTVTADKLIANPADKDKVGVVQADGSIVYQTLSGGNIKGKDLTAEDGSIAVTDGAGATLVNSKVKVADGGINTAKLADGAVTNVKVGADAITTDKIKDGEIKTADVADKNITAAKLDAGTGTAGRLAIADATGAVTYSNTIPSGSITGENVTAGSNKVALGGTPTGAALKSFSVDVDEANLNLANIGGKVTNNQIITGTANQILVTNAAGTATEWIDKSAATSVSNASTGNIITTTVNGTTGAAVNIINTNVTSLDAGNKLITTVNGVASTPLDISTAVVATQKTTTLSNGSNTTATVTTTGNVTDYKVNVNNATATTTGAVKPGAGLTVDGTGTLLVDASAIVTGKALSSNDLTISANGSTSLLKDVNIDIKNGAVTTAKLADGAVTNVKVGADAITTDKIKDGEVKTADLGDKAVTGDKIADKTVTAEKLTANPADKDKVGVVQADGSIVYQTLSATNISGKNLTAEDNSIAVTDGTGATLVNSKLKVADGGITTAKLADGAVTTTKIADGSVTNAKVGADAITTDKIKDGEVKTADVADKNITAAKLDATGATAGQVATANANGIVTYQTLSETNLTSTKGITATGITVTGGAGSTLKDVTLAITDGAITSAKLADGAVTTVKVADGSVTNA
ncbi:hypothetical protein, partial [Pedobacter sp. BMA]|uniref:beta strand repeat-containing protein n=1 Tax=Pedobacter sp. BMA TaxID=1663685 RepID=UPI000649C33B